MRWTRTLLKTHEMKISSFTSLRFENIEWITQRAHVLRISFSKQHRTVCAHKTSKTKPLLRWTIAQSKGQNLQQRIPTKLLICIDYRGCIQENQAAFRYILKIKRSTKSFRLLAFAYATALAKTLALDHRRNRNKIIMNVFLAVWVLLRMSIS